MRRANIAALATRTARESSAPERCVIAKRPMYLDARRSWTMAFCDVIDDGSLAISPFVCSRVASRKRQDAHRIGHPAVKQRTGCLLFGQVEDISHGRSPGRGQRYLLRCRASTELKRRVQHVAEAKHQCVRAITNHVCEAPQGAGIALVVRRGEAICDRDATVCVVIMAKCFKLDSHDLSGG